MAPVEKMKRGLFGATVLPCSVENIIRSHPVFEISQIVQYAHKSVICLIYDIACTLLTCCRCPTTANKLL
jgi:hypothetical protein